MSRLFVALTWAFAFSDIGSAARCTTVMDPRVLREYETYVAAAEQKMSARSNAPELSWVPARSMREAAVKLASGKLFSCNLSDTPLNARIANQNGTVIHWAGAIRIRRGNLADLISVISDYSHYERIYRPIIFESRAVLDDHSSDAPNDVTLGLQSAFRFASVFPQHYAFLAHGRMDFSASSPSDAPAFRAHLRAEDIRESDSGIPGQNDFLSQYHDHGIMWALNAYWRARTNGSHLYLEFETITLARSAQAFVCSVGVVPVPKSIVATAMDALPAQSVETILEGTRAECERRASRQPLQTLHQ